MNGRLNKVQMYSRLIKLKNELKEKCDRNEMGEWECVGANKYLDRSIDILDEFWQWPQLTMYTQKRKLML